MTIENTHDNQLVVFFDIDETLYSSRFKIASAMVERVHAYIVSLGLSHEKAYELRSQYYTQYGLTLRGLRRHHGVDPLVYDKECDGSLPLEATLFPDPCTRKLLEDIDRSKCRVWAFTNAYRPHAERVLKILELRDQVEGIVYCDYDGKDEDLLCKPEPAFYHRAMHQAGVNDPSKCLFVDDNFNNVRAARSVGWIRSVHFRERVPDTEARETHTDKDPKTITKDETPIISSLQQLREVWPDIFLQTDH